MKSSLLLSLTYIILFLSCNLGFSQTIELGTLSSFGAYTGTGAVSNSGTFTGDVGANVGVISGFVPPFFTGTVHNADAVTAQGRIDLLRLYIDLNNLDVTHPYTHPLAFGGETITPGVYTLGGAGSITGALTLDGNNDPDAVFVIKFNGAMAVGAGVEVVLTNDAQACNVFWIAEGAITVGAGSIVKGNLFSHFAAVGLATNCELEGRMLTMEGAITIGAGSTAILPGCATTIQVSCYSGIPADEVDVLGSLENFTLFTNGGAVGNTGTSGVLGDVGTDGGAISGFAFAAHVGTEYNADATTSLAKIDLNNAYAQLVALPNTSTAHPPSFGLGETLTAGVYSIGAAGSLAGTITLDGNYDSDAVFIFKFSGAFTAAAQSKVILINGARRCNVFWIAGVGVPTGAVSIAAGSNLKGTFISHAGACNLGAGTILEGRMFSTGGAVNVNVGIVYLIVDDEAPIVITQNSTVQLDANGDASITVDDVNNGSSDNCTVDSMFLDITNFDCGNVGENTVTLTVVDVNENISTETAIITVEDNVYPIIKLTASDQIKKCDGAGNVSDLNAWLADNGGATASDACGITWSNDFTSLSNDCGNTGSTEVSFTATDPSGNIVSSSATFTIEDTTAPSIDAVASDLTVECDGSGNTTELTNWLNSNGGTGNASDVCSGVTWSNDFVALSDYCGNTGSAAVIFTATDACGLQSTTSATFTIEDTTNPSINTAASNSTVECDGTGDPAGSFATWLANNGGAAASDVCSGVTWSNSSAGLSDDCGNTGTETVTFTATDDCGLQSTTTATFTIEDTTNPMFNESLPADETVACDAVTGAAILTASDNCGTASVTFTEITTDGSSADNYVLTRTWTATDECGNINTHTQIITVQDTEAPVVSCPANITEFATSAGGAVVTYAAPTATDNCDTSIDITSTPASGTVFPIGTTTVAVDAFDNEGNTHQCTFTVTVSGLAPVIVCPNTIVVSNDAGNCDAAVTFAATENVGIPASVVTYSHAPGSIFPVGTTTVTATATNAVGSDQCTFTVTVNDTEDPIISCPASTTVSNEPGLCTAVVTYTPPTATDNCSGDGSGPNLEILYIDNYSDNATEVPNELTSDGHNVTVVLNENSNGWPTVTGDLSAYDLIVWDNRWGYSAPLAALNNIEAWVQAGGNILVTGYDVVFDNEIQVFLGGSSGSDFGGSGNLTVQGPANSLTTGVYNIVGSTIAAIGDWDTLDGPYTAETVNVVDDGRWTLRTIVDGGQIAWLTGYYAQDGKWSTPGSGYYEALKNFAFNTASSGVSVVQTAGLTSGSEFPVGTTTNTFVATDEAGLTATCSFTVTVNDNEAPVYASDLLPNSTIISDTDQSLLQSWVPSNLQSEATLLFTKTVDGSTSQSFHNLCDGIPNTLTVVKTTDGFIFGGYNGGSWNTSNNYQNNTTNFLFSVTNNTKHNLINYPQYSSYNSSGYGPTFGGGHDLHINNSLSGGYTNLGHTYDCVNGSAGTADCRNYLGGSYNNWQIEEIEVWGLNSGAPAGQGLLDIIAQCEVTAIDAPTATDNCAGEITGVSDANLPITDQGTTVVTWTFDDGSGNISTETQNVIIEDNEDPVTPILANVTGQCSATASAPTATDNCSGTLTGTTSDPLTYSTQGTHVITWTFEDAAGNSITALQNVIIDDTTNPVAPTLAHVTGQCSAIASEPTTTDNCSGTLTGTTSDPLTYSTQGTHVITWTFDDGNGNTITANQNVIIDDTTNPVTPTLANVTGQCSATVSAPTTTDNCSGTLTGNTLDLLAYSTQGTHVITWTFDDGNGNTITANQNVIVDDTTNPVTPTLANVTGQCSAAASEPTTTDNCSGTLTGTTSDPLTYTTQGTHVITWTFEDAAGNSITALQNVIVDDTEDPVVACQDITVQLDLSGMATIAPLDITGAPSNHEYTVDQTGAFNPIDISGTGTNVSLSDDAVSGDLPVGFTFNFFGNDYTNFRISSNGFIGFDGLNNNGCCSGQPVPSSGNINNIIALAWEDINPYQGGVIRYETIGTAPNRVLIVEFDNVPHYYNSNPVTMQAQLYEGTSLIEIHTESMPSDGGNHTQGIENIDGTLGYATPVRNSANWSATNDYVAFRPVSVDNTSDNCGIASEVLDIDSFTCADLNHPVTVTVLVTDVNGNTATCSAVVTVEDFNGACNPSYSNINSDIETAFTNKDNSVDLDAYGETGAHADESDNNAITNPLKVSVFPNPSNGVFTLSLNNMNSDTRIFLLDIAGRLIEQKSISSSENSQNIEIGNNTLSPGAYVLRVLSGEKTITKKVIVE